jgi:hypothetical protein
MRKLLDQAWKTSAPDSLETREEEIGTHYTGDRNTTPIHKFHYEYICIAYQLGLISIILLFSLSLFKL